MRTYVPLPPPLATPLVEARGMGFEVRWPDGDPTTMFSQGDNVASGPTASDGPAEGAVTGELTARGGCCWGSGPTSVSPQKACWAEAARALRGGCAHGDSGDAGGG